MNRVVITGLGSVTPIGNNTDTFWQSLQKGTNGINKISIFDTTNFDVKIAAEVKIDLKNYFNSKELNKIDRFSAFALIAAEEAINQSNLIKSKINLNRIGVIVGSGIGGIHALEKQHNRLLKNPKKVSPYFIPSMITDIAPGHISIKYGFKGPNYSVVSACATASHAIGDAYKIIKYGDADAIIAGGSEAGISPLSIAGFSNMKALSKNSNIDEACRPFDLKRDGFVMGEGSGILVLENLNSAKKRDANILCEIVGYGATADAYHLTTPSPNGKGAKIAMEQAINEAQINKNEIDYINTHGTSTPYNDKNETIAIKDLFKEHAYKLSLSSSKSMTGHLLGASGGIESIASILTIINSVITPTINYNNKDEECDLDYTFNYSKIKNVNYALSNSFGFGGHNASLLFKKYNI
ncbi:MAG: beta-ketoacyl-[acyl-carrier-protein] synthase II [Candidatus Marinimicrobia bacterium]|nr:beta-ketoacyl-[acyl-carrier-protein] synthase II [Candidatus Neomarinimicrobiota bacterium]